MYAHLPHSPFCDLAVQPLYVLTENASRSFHEGAAAQRSQVVAAVRRSARMARGEGDDPLARPVERLREACHRRRDREPPDGVAEEHRLVTFERVGQRFQLWTMAFFDL